MELVTPFDSQSESSLYEQIYQYIRGEIRLARLEAGSRLPSTRVLAQNLKVNHSTTQMAYDQLLSEGYIEALPYRGYYVCRVEKLVEIRQGSPGSFVVGRESGGQAYEIDFSPRGIDLESLPSDIWRKLNRSILMDDDKDMFTVGNPRGELSPRTAIGAYFHSARGANCSPDQILIGAGSGYLLMLLGQTLGNDLGDDLRIAAENPTYERAYHVLRRVGCSVVPVEMGRYGMNMDRLSCSGARVACITSSHQYPTGIVMPVKRRQGLLAWAYGSRGYLIGDNYDSEFRYRGMPIPALQGMDRGGRVIYMGAFSRSIAPTVRVGFMVLPRHLTEKYRERAGFYASTVSKIDQNILCRSITQGYYERHLNRMGAVYKGKHDVLLAGLKDLGDRFVISGECAGLRVLLTSRRKGGEMQLVEWTAATGVEVCAMSGCSISPQHGMDSSMVMLGYAGPSEKEIEKEIRLLDQAWKKPEKGSEKRPEI